MHAPIGSFVQNMGSPTIELGDTRLNECTNERVFISFYIEFQELCSTQLRINFNYLKIVKTQIMQ